MIRDKIIGFNPRSKIIIILIYLIFILAVSTINGTVLLLMVPLVLLIGCSGTSRQVEPDLDVSRDRDVYRSTIGEEVNVQLKVHNRGKCLRHLTIRDLIPAGLTKSGGVASMITTLNSGASVTLEYTLTGKLGTYHFPGVEIVLPDMAGLNPIKHKIPSMEEVVILPGNTFRKGLILRPHRTRLQSGLNPSRQGGEGMELFGIREFRPGDSLRHINSRASARHPQSFFIQEFEHERVATVVLILDTRDYSLSFPEEGNFLQHIVEATGMLGEALINSGNRVGLYIFGNYNGWVFPGSGKLQKERLLRTLALEKAIEPTRLNKLADLPSRLLPPRSVILFISPLQGNEPWMMRVLKGLKHQVMVVSPDEITFEREKPTRQKNINLALRTANLERMLFVRELQNSSIPVLNWEISTPFEPLISKFLGTYWQ